MKFYMYCRVGRKEQINEKPKILSNAENISNFENVINKNKKGDKQNWM